MQQLKRVIMVGKAHTSLEGLQETIDRYPQAEVWATATHYQGWRWSRLDRVFEIHKRWMFSDPNYNQKHYQALLSGVGCQVWMLERHADIPGSQKAPVSAIIDGLQSQLQYFDPESGQRFTNPYMTSTFDYMMGTAIMERFEEVFLFGFDFSMETEYRYQRPGAAYWIGYANGKGIRVIRQKNIAMLHPAVYGEGGYQVVPRHTLELQITYYKNAEEKYKAEVNKLSGIFHKAAENAQRADTRRNREEARKASEELERAKANLYLNTGARLNLEKLIQTADLQEPEELSLENPYIRPVQEGIKT